MQISFVALFLLVSFSETLIRGEQANVRKKHLFVQRKAPLRGSSLPYREILVPENGEGSARPSLKDIIFRRSKRSTRERRSTNNDPTETLVSYKLRCCSFLSIYLHSLLDKFNINVNITVYKK